LGLAGATVTRGVMGFGKHSVIHKAHLLGLSDDLPEKIEIVYRPEEIDRVLPFLEEMIVGGLIVVEDVHVVRCDVSPLPAASEPVGVRIANTDINFIVRGGVGRIRDGPGGCAFGRCRWRNA
jgi:hypothetical protein